MKLKYDGYDRAKVHYKVNGAWKRIDVTDGCEIDVPDDDAKVLLKERGFSAANAAKPKKEKKP